MTTRDYPRDVHTYSIVHRQKHGDRHAPNTEFVLKHTFGKQGLLAHATSTIVGPIHRRMGNTIFRRRVEAGPEPSTACTACCQSAINFCSIVDGVAEDGLDYHFTLTTHPHTHPASDTEVLQKAASSDIARIRRAH